MMIETERLVLRPWRDGDAAELYKYASDPEVGPAAGWPPHKTLMDSLEAIRGPLAAKETYAVVPKETGLPAGCVGLLFKGGCTAPVSDDEAELGYWIGRPLWGRGLIPEAARAMMCRAFGEFGMKGIWCGYYDGNDKSRRVQEKCGFTYRCTEKDKPCPPMGDVRTEHFSYITREQWRGSCPIRDRLFAIRDGKYRDFQSKLMPTMEKSRIIGVRTPALRSFAKELAGSAAAAEFTGALPHAYFDEYQLHAFIISLEKDAEKAFSYTEAFLPFVDNWATCDQLSPKVFKKHKAELFTRIERWIRSDETYTVRFAVGMLMEHFLDDDFDEKQLDMAAGVTSGEYYVKMMVAWYFATALAKQYDAAVRFIEEKRLDPWTHNMTIRKAAESFRVSDAHKEHLRTLRLKGKA